MKKRIFSLLTALALCLGLLPGTALAAVDGPLDFTSQTSTSGDGYSWDANTLTLKLTDFTQTIPNTSKSGKAVVLPADSTLVLEGESTITNNSPGGTCIQYEGQLTIKGDGILNLDLAMQPSSSCCNGIYEKSDTRTTNVVTIESGTLNITGRCPNSNSNGYVGISGAEVRLSGGTVNMENVTYGVNAYYYWVNTRKFIVDGGAFYYGKSSDYAGELKYAVSTGSGREASEFTSEVSISDGTVDISGTDNAFSVEHTPVSVTGGNLRIHDLVREATASGVVQETCAFLTGAGSRTEAEPKISLTGGNIEISGCDYILSAVNILGMDMLEVGGGVELAGLVHVNTYGNDGQGVSQVRVYGDYTLTESISFHEGYSYFWDIGLAEGSTLTIPDGMTFDLSNLVRSDDTGEDTYDLSGGEIINNGILALPNKEADEIQAYIKTLDISGSGLVEVRDRITDAVIATYTNTGVRPLDPAGNLDLSANAGGDAANWDTQGYKWENVQTDENGQITSGTLVLAEGFNAEKVILPDAAVEIVSQGECVIGTLTPPGGPDNGHADKLKLTFSGAGPLTVREFINISGGHENALTVARDAVVIAENGITVCADGAVDGLVTVNGTLTSRADSGSAVVTGKVSVGPSGTLKVSGDTGVALGGVNGSFDRAFELAPGGRFTGDCENNIILASKSNGAAFDADLEAADILVIPDGYLPQGLEPEFNEDRTSLAIPGGEPFNISSDNLPPDPDPVPAHVHLWAEDWTAGETHHWHECAAAGCPVRENSGKYGYEEHRYDDDQDGECNVCGYRRTLTPSGGGSSGRGGGGGSSVAYAITVEKSAHGKVTPSRASAGVNSAVTLTVSPSSGYALDSLTVTDSRGGAVTLTAQGARKYLFTMPGRAVTVRAVFVPLSGGQTPCDGGAGCPSRGFADLGGPGTWYHEAVDYVLERGLMGGYGDGLFRPDNRLTRAQFAQILYNQAGRPAVTGEVPFTDVAPDAWCAPAVAWAAERGITGGYGGGLFGPDEPITREQLAVMLWRWAGSPAAPGGDPGFTDAEQIAAHAREAVRWAAQAGVMNGKTGGALDPKAPATRAQAASTLKNYLKDSET